MAETSPFLKRFDGQVSIITKDGSQKKGGQVSTKRASTNPEKGKPKFPAINNRTTESTYSNPNGNIVSGGAIKMANNGYSSGIITNGPPSNNNGSINIQRIDQQGYGYPIQPEPPLPVQLPPLSKGGVNNTSPMQYNNITVNGTDPSVDYLRRLAESAYKEFPSTQFAPTQPQSQHAQHPQHPQAPQQYVPPFPSQTQTQGIQYRNSTYTQPQVIPHQQSYPMERYSYPPYQPPQQQSVSMYNIDSNSYAQQYQYPNPSQPFSIYSNNTNPPSSTQPPPLSFPPEFNYSQDQNDDDELKTPSSRDGSPKKGSKKDQLYYSRQPREVYFKPYTQSDYKAKKMEIASMKMGSLGPDLQNEDYLARKEKTQRMKEYAERAKALQTASPTPIRSTPASAPTSQSRSTPSLSFTTTKEEQRAAQEKRQKAMEFARTVPRPKPKAKVSQVSGISSGGLPANHPWLVGRDEEEDDDESVELQNLEIQHQLARQTVVQIRKEVMG
eukprot:TRINITY_DN803_c0_g1_i1.p1 TRINITY_DN803_c0_g1~~TRINITY_DN803_c0_g1_i1.p1  ORF type:complete len:497 (+),score=117.06 TRINITY_DN803_c0_g1_i1:234-1724(+)